MSQIKISEVTKVYVGTSIAALIASQKITAVSPLLIAVGYFGGQSAGTPRSIGFFRSTLGIALVVLGLSLVGATALRISQLKNTTSGMLTASEFRRAEILGRALLLAHRFSASVPAILIHARLQIDSDAVRLQILDAQSNPDSAAVQNRVWKLAKATGLSRAEIVK